MNFPVNGQENKQLSYSSNKLNSLISEVEYWRKYTKVNPDSAYQQLHLLLEESRKVNYKRAQVRALVNLGRIDVLKGKYYEALDKYYEALFLCDTLTQKSAIASLYNDIGSLYNYLAKYEDALAAYHKALQVNHQIEYYNNIANVLAQLKQNKKAIQYLEIAIEYAESTKHYDLLSKLYINIAMNWFELNEYNKVHHYLNEAIIIAEENQFYRDLNIATLNKGLLYLKLNENEKAIASLLEAKNYLDKPGITKKERIETISILGETYLKNGNLSEAEKYLAEADSFSNILPVIKLNLLQNLAKLYAETNRPGKAYQMLNDFVELKDSIQNVEVALKVSEMEFQYKDAEKDKVIMEHQLELFRQNKELSSKNLWIIIITGGALFIIMFLAWRYAYVKQKNKSLKSELEIDKLKAMMEGGEKERTRLARDLHDGVSSQLAATKSYVLAMGQAYPHLEKSYYLEKVNTMLNEMTSEVRQIAHNLAPDDLLRKGLVQVIYEYSDSLFSGYQIETEVQVYGQYEDIDIPLSLGIYRIIQELLHNVVKHAKATAVILLLNRTDDQITLTVEDNGTGIKMNEMNNLISDGLGLASLKERVKTLNGVLSIERGEERGTAINIVFKITKATKPNLVNYES